MEFVIKQKAKKKHMYYVFHFMHLHVLVLLDHLQGAFFLQNTLLSKFAGPICKYLYCEVRVYVVRRLHLNTKRYAHRHTGHIRYFNL
jgi:hypothetical protein